MRRACQRTREGLEGRNQPLNSKPGVCKHGRGRGENPNGRLTQNQDARVKGRRSRLVA